MKESCEYGVCKLIFIGCSKVMPLLYFTELGKYGGAIAVECGWDVEGWKIYGKFLESRLPGKHFSEVAWKITEILLVGDGGRLLESSWKILEMILENSWKAKRDFFEIHCREEGV